MQPLQPVNAPPRRPLIARYSNPMGGILLALGTLALGANHWMALNRQRVSLWALLLGPMFCLFGVATIYDGRILLAGGNDASAIPAYVKFAAAAILVLSIAISAWLILSFYDTA